MMQDQGMRLAIILLTSLVLCACAKEETAREVPPVLGMWQARLLSPGGALGFEMELKEDSDGTLRGFIMNGKERIEIPQVAVIGDTFIANIDHYESKLEATIRDDGTRLIGKWKKRRGPRRWAELRFEADAGEGRRFPAATETMGDADFDGRWRVRFKSDAYDSVGIFNHIEDDRWEGTFLTRTGDYRYLAGNKDGNRLRLSCFDGAHAFLFDVIRTKDGKLQGHFWNWNTWHDTWTGTYDKDAKLPDPFKQTKWNEGKKLKNLAFPDLAGVTRKLGTLLPDGHVRIVYLFGSWCPNCHDATLFLKTMESRFGRDKLKICGVAFELNKNHERDARQVRRYAELHDVSWPMLIGGNADKKEATAAFGGVDDIHSYPTMIFINKEGRIAAIYSGFTGPASSSHKTMEGEIFGLLTRLTDG